MSPKAKAFRDQDDVIERLNRELADAQTKLTDARGKVTVLEAAAKKPSLWS